MRRVLRLLTLFPLLLISTVVSAHEVRPGYLEIRQTGEETFDLTWKVPRRGDVRMAIDPRLPDSCSSPAPTASYTTGNAFVDRWTVSCTGGLVDRTIEIDGLAGAGTDTLVRLQRLDGTVQVELLTPDGPSFTVRGAPSAFGVAATYGQLGVEHILLGIDHLLFVLVLLILVDGRRRLIGTITAFTLAHSLTLAAATLGFVHVPQSPVEAIIALSIVFVATEIVHAKQGRPGLTERAPWIVAFTFGLLHGFGFAGALTEIGLPEQSIPLALLFFNLGVEVGQLLFIAAVEIFILAARRVPVALPTWSWRVPAYGIGTIAAYWTVERIVGFWG